jgi:gluconokinase
MSGPVRVLALDLGTSSARALVLAGGRDPFALARRPVRLDVDATGKAELSPRAYLGAVVACLDELHSAGGLDEVGDVVVTGQWHSLLATDAAGDPLSGVLTWADTRSAGTEPSVADPGGLHRRTGAWIHPHFWTGKAPWLLAQLGSRPRQLMGLTEYVVAVLCGDRGVSVSQASGTGLLDWARSKWDPEALDVAGVSETMLPPLLPGDWSGRLAESWARRWPALATARWRPPVGDGAAANLGSGCVDERRVAITVGTSAAVRVVQSASAVGPLPPSLWRFRVDADRVVTGMAFSAGGGLYGWARDLLRTGGTDREPADPSLEAVPVGGTGLVVLPFHAGTRAPRTVPAGSGVITGLSMATTPAQVTAAVIESVCFELADGFAALLATLPRDPTVVGGGGALERSAPWRRRLAAMLDRPLRMPATTEVSARGAAMLMENAPIERRAFPRWAETVEPSPPDVQAMLLAKERFEQLRELHGIAPAGLSQQQDFWHRRW